MQNLNCFRPVMLFIRDKRTGALNQTQILVQANDPRSDDEIRKQFRTKLKASRRHLADEARKLKLSKDFRSCVTSSPILIRG